jgi:hypothetical protein
MRRSETAATEANVSTPNVECRIPDLDRPNPFYPRYPRLRIQSKEFARGSREQLSFLVRREVFHRFDKCAWVGFAEWEWVVGTERDTLRAKYFEQQLQRVGIVHE